MSTRLFRILASLSGIVGVIMLITSFVINPGPPPNPTIEQLIAFVKQYETSVLIGSWLQAVSPVLIVFFALALAHLAGEAEKISGSMLLLGGIILVLVSLIEVTFYLLAVYNPATEGKPGLDIISAVQHLYSIIAAPALFFPLAVIILKSSVIPRVFGYLALVLGCAFTVMGIVALLISAQDIVNDLAYAQGLWWLSAAIALLVSAFRQPNTQGVQAETAI